MARRAWVHDLPAHSASAPGCNGCFCSRGLNEAIEFPVLLRKQNKESEAAFSHARLAHRLAQSKRITQLPDHQTVWRRGWDSARSLRELPADMPLRGRVGRTGLSSATTLGRKTRTGPTRGPVLVFWRRGWDSNPRYGRTVHLISNQAHSTTLAPLLNSALYPLRRYSSPVFSSVKPSIFR